MGTWRKSFMKKCDLLATMYGLSGKGTGLPWKMDMVYGQTPHSRAMCEVPSRRGCVGSGLVRDWCFVISAHMYWFRLSIRERNARSQSNLCTPCWTSALSVMSLLGTGFGGGPPAMSKGNEAAERYLGSPVSPAVQPRARSSRLTQRFRMRVLVRGYRLPLGTACTRRGSQWETSFCTH